MATEDKYGQQLQAWFEQHATTEGRSAYEAQQAIGCSRQRVYQWLATGAVDVIETGEMSERGAKLYQYVAGTRDRATAGKGRRPVAGVATRTRELVAVTGLALTATEAFELMGKQIQVVGVHVDEARGVVVDCRTDDGQVLHMVATA